MNEILEIKNVKWVKPISHLFKIRGENMGNKNFMVLDTKKYDKDNTLYYYLYNPEKVLIYSEKALKAEMTKNNLSVLNISKHLEKKMILTVTDYRLPLTVPQNEKESFYFDLLDDLICGPFNANIPFK